MPAGGCRAKWRACSSPAGWRARGPIATCVSAATKTRRRGRPATGATARRLRSAAQLRPAGAPRPAPRGPSPSPARAPPLQAAARRIAIADLRTDRREQLHCSTNPARTARRREPRTHARHRLRRHARLLGSAHAGAVAKQTVRRRCPRAAARARCGTSSSRNSAWGEATRWSRFIGHVDLAGLAGAPAAVDSVNAPAIGWADVAGRWRGRSPVARRREGAGEDDGSDQVPAHRTSRLRVSM